MDKQRIAPFLTFSGRAEEAMNFYAAQLPDTRISQVVRYGKDHPYAGENEENLVLFGSLSVLGNAIMFMDMAAAYPTPEFSWSTSLYVDCRDEAEFDAVFNGLAPGGQVMMGPEPVGNLRKCAWVTDKFGVTWQPVWE